MNNKPIKSIAGHRIEMTYVEELRELLGHRPIIFVAVPVLILDDESRVLLQLRADDYTWCLPGGYMELGESTMETARREIKEETGLEIGLLSLFDVFSGSEFFNEFPNGDKVYSVSVVYFTYEVQGECNPDGQEGLELKYYSRCDLPPNITPHARTIIEDFWRKNINED